MIISKRKGGAGGLPLQKIPKMQQNRGCRGSPVAKKVENYDKKAPKTGGCRGSASAKKNKSSQKGGCRGSPPAKKT